MFRVKPIILLIFIVISAGFGPVSAQWGSNVEKSSSLDYFFGFDGLRPNNTSQFYNHQFLKDSTYYYNKEDTSIDFQLSKKVVFDYDNQGRLLVENEFEKIDNNWNKSLKRIFNYNDEGLVEYSVIKRWNEAAEDFENKQRTFFFSNSLGLISQEIIEIYSFEEWLAQWKHDHFYNDKNNIVEELSHKWSSELLEWEPKKRRHFEYNDNADLESEVIQVWVDTLGQWVNSAFRGYEYNEDNQLINMRQSTWNQNLQEWIEQTYQALSYTAMGQVQNSSSYDAVSPTGDAKESIEATYDEDGNLNTTIFREWNSENKEWESYEKHEHFWNQYLFSSPPLSDDRIECFYTNPHTVGLPWHCNALLKQEQYIVSVFDHNGVLHHLQTIRGGDTFRLTKQLNNGLYMVVISGGLTVHTEKVFIRN